MAVDADPLTRERLVRHEAALKRLARLSSIETAEAAPPQSVQFVLDRRSYALPLAGMIDIAAEITRLSKAAAKARGEVERIDKKLSNERFVANAPDEVVEQEREKRAAYLAEAEKLEAALAMLR